MPYSTKAEFRRFRTVGETGKIRHGQLAEDKFGTFMLYSDHVDVVRQAECEGRQRANSLKQQVAELTKTVIQLEERCFSLCQEVEKGRGEPSDYAVVCPSLGKTRNLYPTRELAEAAVKLAAHFEGVDESVFGIQPRWK